MANFCTNCGNPVKPNWEFCPSCSNKLYLTPKLVETPVIEPYQSVTFQSENLEILGTVKKREARLTKKQKKSLIIGIIVIAASVITPIATIFMIQYFYPQNTVNFYVNHGNTPTSYIVSTSRDILNFFEDEPHPSHSHWDPDYVASVIASYCTPNYSKIIQVSEAIQAKCLDQNDSEEVVNALLSFTQAIGYRTEIIDRTKYPMETLFSQGDCEDLSVLFGSLVVSLGYEAILAVINYYDTVEDRWFGHACIGVYLNFTPTHHLGYPPSHSFTVNSKEYWICETTSQGWMVGHLPTLDPSHYVMEAYEFIN
ncbi:MAG: zinc-ribbon domain-containing protein [Candidatus Hermodarchaeota archaeon]